MGPKTHPPMPTLKDSYTLWANQMAVSTPSSPPQQNSVFGQGSDTSLRSTLGMRKRRDKRASVSSLTSPSRSLSVRRAASTSGHTPSASQTSNNGVYMGHPSPPKRNASLHISKVKSGASDDNSLSGTTGSHHHHHPTNHAHAHHARVPSNSSFNFAPHPPSHSRSPSDVFAPDHISLHHKTDSMSSSDLDTLEQLVQPDLSMPDKATASLDQLYSLLAERTVQLSHNSYQNTQLWAMVNKQRQMILDLQRDLDSSLEVNARYKRRLLRATEGRDSGSHQNGQNASTGNSIPGTGTNGSVADKGVTGAATAGTSGPTSGSATTDPGSAPNTTAPAAASDANSTTATSAKSNISSTPSPNGSTSSVATSINNVNTGSSAQPSLPTSNSQKHIPQPIVPLPYPLPAISSAREPKGAFSFEEDRDGAKTHRKTKSDTLNDDSFLVPEKSPSRDPRLRPKKSMASVVSQDDSSAALGATTMSKSASMGAPAAPSTPSLPPPALAPEPITLYVKPTELSTIRVDVASSLGVARKKDTPVVVLSVSDRATCKELWRCSKEYSAFVTLDNAISPQIPSFKTKIPDRSLFTSHAPARVDIRKDQLNGWFGSLLAIPRLPSSAAQTLCEFLSTNTMDPLDVPDGDARKEGFLTKRGKSFGGWKLRYFVLDGPMLNYYESPNGPHLGAIRLYNARIGRQTQEEDSNSEDAYRHAFLVMEPRKKDYVRHVLCAENDRERDDWIEALLEFVTLPEPESPVKSIHSPAITTVSTNTSTLNAYGESIYDEYSEAPTPTLPTTEAIDSVMESQKGTGLGIDVGSSDTLGSSGGGARELNPVSSGVVPSASNSRISAPIASEPIQNLQKWGYKYSPSSQSLNAQLQGDGLDDHGASLSPNHNHHTAIAAPVPEVKEKKKFFLFRKGNSDRHNQADKQHTSTPEYLQSVLEAEGMIQREERPSTPSLQTPTQSQFDNSDYHQSGVFGVPLLQAIESSSKDIDGHVVPSVVWRCIQYLDDQKAHVEEGIFRLSGSASAIRILKARFNDHYDIDLVADSSTVFDVHAVAGLLKLFLREMPSLILTQQLSPAFRRAMEIPDIVNRIYELKKLVKQLPAESRDLLFVLAQYLCKIIEHQDYNKMNLRNVGIVFSPTVNVPAGIFVLFLTDFDCIFGDAQPRTDINRKLQDFPQALLG